jgi:hypothetical protein
LVRVIGKILEEPVLALFMKDCPLLPSIAPMFWRASCALWFILYFIHPDLCASLHSFTTSSLRSPRTREFDKLKVKSVQQGRSGFQFNVNAPRIPRTVCTRRLNPHPTQAATFTLDDLNEACANSGNKLAPLIRCGNDWQRGRRQSCCR